MDAKLVLALSGVRHIEDRSLSLLKAFIGQLPADRFPVPFRGALALVIEASRNDVGRRSVELRGMDPDGSEIVSRQRYTVDIPRDGENFSFLFAVEPDLRRPGDYAFVAMIDDVESDRCTLMVRVRGSTDGDSE